MTVALELTKLVVDPFAVLLGIFSYLQGPMVYGVSFAPLAKAKELKSIGFAGSLYILSSLIVRLENAERRRQRVFL